MLIHGLRGTYAPFDTATILYQGFKETGKACADKRTGEVAVAFRGTPSRYGTELKDQATAGDEIYLVCTITLDEIDNLDFLAYDPLEIVTTDAKKYKKKRKAKVSTINPTELAMRVAQMFSKSISPNHPYAKKETRTISLQISELAPMSDGGILVVGETTNLQGTALPIVPEGKQAAEPMGWMAIYAPVIAMTNAVSLMDVVASRAGVEPDVAYRVMREIRDTMAAAVYDGLALGLSGVTIKVPGFMEVTGEVTRTITKCRIKADPAFRRQVMASVSK